MYITQQFRWLSLVFAMAAWNAASMAQAIQSKLSSHPVRLILRLLSGIYLFV